MTGSDAVSVSVLVALTDVSRIDTDYHDAVVATLANQGGVEVIYLGDAGTIEASSVLDVSARRPESVRVIQFSRSVGRAAMLRAGAERARGSLLLTLPAPLEVDLSVLPEMTRRIDDGADLVVAIRRAGASRPASAQSRLFNRIISLAAGMRVHDVASETRVMRRSVLAEIPLYGDFHRYLPILAERAGFAVRQIDAVERADAHRPALYKPADYLWRAIDVITVLFISRFTRKPLRLFGSFGSVFLGAGVVLLGVIGVQRLLGTPLANRPILVLAVLLVGLGVQAFTIGLLAELLLFLNARSFCDYRVAAVWEAGVPLPAGDPAAAPVLNIGSEAAPPAPAASVPRRTSGTRPRD